MQKRIVFPMFNAVLQMLLFGAVGYYIGNLLPWLVAAAVSGFMLGLLLELLLGLTGLQSQFYRRRGIVAALLQIVLMVFGVGPYAFALQMSQPSHQPIEGASPADFGAIYESVSFSGADGVILTGWYVPPPLSGRDAVIIVLPGRGSNRLGSMAHGQVLYEGGYGLLLYDPRATGESGGDVQSWGWLDRYDVAYAIDFLRDHAGIQAERIGGVGLSQGAHILLMAMPDEPRLVALWADGLRDNRSTDIPTDQIGNQRFGVFMSDLVEFYLSLIVGESPPPSSFDLLLAVDDRSIQLVAGGADQLETAINRFLIDSADNDNLDLWVIDNAGHVGGLDAVRSTYVERMLAFFDAALLTE